jgi:predicted NACHT family NTPase
MWLDLHEVGSDAQLNRELFDCSEIATWKVGDNNLHLFLDSFDECRLQISTLVPRLLREIGRWPTSRLHLRIASRTADWSLSLEEGFRGFWHVDDLGVFELAPLRRRDVELVANRKGWVPNDFLTQIDRADAVPLAIKPLTLEFLTRMFGTSGVLPNNPIDLYHEGTRLLCEETERRRELRLPQRLDAQQRKSVAERIAALTMLANRAAVWIDVDRGDAPEDDVKIRQITEDGNFLVSVADAIDESDVEETLGTSLFSSRGARRLGWAHQTLAEFLTASYMDRIALPLPQIRQLLFHPSDGRLIPALRQVAAWLAGMREDVLLDLLELDPESMLRSAASALGETARAALVDALLNKYDVGALVDRDREQYQHYHRLIHPGLAEQLLPYIADSARSSVARRVAIDIAEACALRELVNNLVAVALENEEEIGARVNAAYAVTRIGTVEERGRLKPLVYITSETDPDDELKGCGLRAVWPEHLTADELFTLLTPFKGNLSGAYRSFFWSHLTEKLPLLGLPCALEWVQRVVKDDKLSYEYEQLVDEIMRLSWKHLGEPGVLDAFVLSVLTRLRQYQEPFGLRGNPDTRSLFNESDDNRRLVLAAALSRASDEDLMSLAQASLVRSSDVLWIVERLSHLTVKERNLWAALLPLVLDYSDVSQVNEVLSFRERDDIVREALRPYFDPVELDSPEAQRARETFQHLKRWRELDLERSASVDRLQIEVLERISTYLSRFESGELNAWWWLNYELAIDPTRRALETEYESDLTSLPGWQHIGAEDRTRLVAAAEQYVQQRQASGEDWLGSMTIQRPDFAGYRALRLLLQEAPDRFTGLSKSVWQSWAEVVVGFHSLSSGENATAIQNLVSHAYKYAPEQVLTALSTLITKTDSIQPYDIDSKLWRLEECWDSQMTNFWIHQVGRTELTSRTRGLILRLLLVHGVAAGREMAESMLSMPLGNESRELAISAAVALCEETDDAGWTVVWPAFQTDSEFGAQVIAHLAWNEHSSGAVLQRLPVHAVADLFLWLAKRYPHSEDVRPVGVHQVSARESIGDWRDSLVGHLVRRGTWESCEAVERIAGELPQLEWLKWNVLEAREVTRHRTWTPIPIAELRAILHSPVRRIIQSAEQLLDVIIESLDRLEERLQQAEPPAAIDLWNEVQYNVFSPKTENQFSDYVARHLELDLVARGIVVNREVVVRRGERLDIRVNVSRVDGTEESPYPLTVVIESKGCWNRAELDTAMKEQLVNRYMNEGRTRHGVFLVGWFKCEEWNHDENRRRQCPIYDLGDARRRFATQAEELSVGGKVVRAFVLDAGLR